MRLVLRAYAGLQRGGEHARIGADWQRVRVGLKTARDGADLARAVRLRERLRAPGRLTAGWGRLDPDLEDTGLGRLEIVLGVADAAAGTHHLPVARLGAPLIAEA